MSASTIRVEEQRLMRGLRLDGDILDVGGDRRSGYLATLAGDHRVTVANINLRDYDADLEFDAEQPWPVPDAAYDAVLMLNFLEHVYETDAVVAEARRVLKPGGRLIVTVPFIFSVHGSPSDYHRWTRWGLERLMAKHGFAYRIEPLGTGLFSTFWQPIGGFLRWAPLAGLGRGLAAGLDRLVARLKPGSHWSVEHYPLGYFVEATRIAP